MNLRDAARFGILDVGASVDLAAAKERVRSIRAAISPHYSAEAVVEKRPGVNTSGVRLT